MQRFTLCKLYCGLFACLLRPRTSTARGHTRGMKDLVLGILTACAHDAMYECQSRSHCADDGVASLTAYVGCAPACGHTRGMNTRRMNTKFGLGPLDRVVCTVPHMGLISMLLGLLAVVYG